MEFWTYIQDGIAYPKYLKAEFAGVTFYAEDADLQLLGVGEVVGRLVDGEKPVYRHLSVVVPTCSVTRTVHVLVTERTDALKLALAFSKEVRFGIARVYSNARYLAVCQDGEVVVRRTLNDFYLDVDPEDLAATALE